MYAPFDNKFKVRSAAIPSEVTSEYATCEVWLQVSSSQCNAQSDALTFALLETVRLVLEERDESDDERNLDPPGWHLIWSYLSSAKPSHKLFLMKSNLCRTHPVCRFRALVRFLPDSSCTKEEVRALRC